MSARTEASSDILIFRSFWLRSSESGCKIDPLQAAAGSDDADAQVAAAGAGGAALANERGEVKQHDMSAAMRNTGSMGIHLNFI
jgi:hypothetical protein